MKHYIKSLPIMTKAFNPLFALEVPMLKEVLFALLLAMGVSPALMAAPNAYMLTGDERGVEVWQQMQLLTDPDNSLSTAAITANPQAFDFEPLRNTEMN